MPTYLRRFYLKALRESKNAEQENYKKSSQQNSQINRINIPK